MAREELSQPLPTRLQEHLHPVVTPNSDIAECPLGARPPWIEGHCLNLSQTACPPLQMPTAHCICQVTPEYSRCCPLSLCRHHNLSAVSPLSCDSHGGPLLIQSVPRDNTHVSSVPPPHAGVALAAVLTPMPQCRLGGSLPSAGHPPLTLLYLRKKRSMSPLSSIKWQLERSD